MEFHRDELPVPQELPSGSRDCFVSSLCPPQSKHWNKKLAIPSLVGVIWQNWKRSQRQANHQRARLKIPRSEASSGEVNFAIALATAT
jgi:hypothetical protein